MTLSQFGIKPNDPKSATKNTQILNNLKGKGVDVSGFGIDVPIYVNSNINTDLEDSRISDFHLKMVDYKSNYAIIMLHSRKGWKNVTFENFILDGNSQYSGQVEKFENRLGGLYHTGENLKIINGETKKFTGTGVALRKGSATVESLHTHHNNIHGIYFKEGIYKVGKILAEYCERPFDFSTEVDVEFDTLIGQNCNLGGKIALSQKRNGKIRIKGKNLILKNNGTVAWNYTGFTKWLKELDVKMDVDYVELDGNESAMLFKGDLNIGFLKETNTDGKYGFAHTGQGEFKVAVYETEKPFYHTQPQNFTISEMQELIKKMK